MKIFSHLVKSKEFNLLVPRYATPKEEGSQQQQKKNQKRIYPFWLKSSLNQKKSKKKNLEIKKEERDIPAILTVEGSGLTRPADGNKSLLDRLIIPESPHRSRVPQRSFLSPIWFFFSDKEINREKVHWVEPSAQTPIAKSQLH